MHRIFFYLNCNGNIKINIQNMCYSILHYYCYPFTIRHFKNNCSIFLNLFLHIFYS